MSIGLNFKDVEKQNDIGANEIATSGYQMFNANLTKSINLGKEDSNAFIVFSAVFGLRDFNQGAYFSSKKNRNVENLEYLVLVRSCFLTA